MPGLGHARAAQPGHPPVELQRALGDGGRDLVLLGGHAPVLLLDAEGRIYVLDA